MSYAADDLVPGYAYPPASHPQQQQQQQQRFMEPQQDDERFDMRDMWDAMALVQERKRGDRRQGEGYTGDEWDGRFGLREERERERGYGRFVY